MLHLQLSLNLGVCDISVVHSTKVFGLLIAKSMYDLQNCVFFLQVTGFEILSYQ